MLSLSVIKAAYENLWRRMELSSKLNGATRILDLSLIRIMENVRQGHVKNGRENGKMSFKYRLAYPLTELKIREVWPWFCMKKGVVILSLTAGLSCKMSNVAVDVGVIMYSRKKNFNFLTLTFD